jgi:hypothetical protein
LLVVRVDLSVTYNKIGDVLNAGQRDGLALCGISDRAGANQLIALLGPGTVDAGEDPCSPCALRCCRRLRYV